MAEDERKPDPARELFSEFAQIVPGLGAAFLVPFLEWQRALLKSYQKTLQDPSFRQAWGDHAKTLAKAVMASYLDASRSEREPGERLVAMQSDLINAYLEALEGVLRRFEGRKA